MDRRELGRTGIQVPRLGLGTVKLGRNRGVKYPTAYELPSDAAMRALLDRALEDGVRLIDTAPAYGIAEERLGPWVETHRDELVLCTKAGEDFDGTSSHFDFSARALEASLESSLDRLRVDHVDLLLLHSDGRDTEILQETDALEGLRRIRASGKARAVGLSAKTAEGVEAAARELDVVMAPYGGALPELGVALQAAHEAGCGVLAIKVLGQGHALEGSDDRSPVQRAFDEVFVGGFVDAAVIGTTSCDHLSDAARAVQTTLRRVEAATPSEEDSP